MTIHKEGYASITVVIIFCLILNAVVHFYIDHVILKYLSYALTAFLMVAILQFFRKPNRTVIQNDNHIISSADGKVVTIEEVYEDEYFKDKRRQVSVFMSPINVHMNRHTIGGKIKYAKYHPGKYLVAWHPKSSTENERTTIVTEHKSGKALLLRQIAGALARRIVFYCKEGDEVQQGSECGFIKFGSRVDLFLPLDAIVEVKIGEAVKGGETVIARFN